jgi:hypothetical protein
LAEEVADDNVSRRVGRPVTPVRVRAERCFFAGVKVTADELIGVVTDLEATVRAVRQPHPVAPQTGKYQVVRLLVHRRPAHPIGEGQDLCPAPQDVTGKPEGRADPAQPDRGRLGQLLPARSRETRSARSGFSSGTA